MRPRNVGEAILCRLKQLGVEFFFANPGTEFISVIRGFQELPCDQVPRPILAPHEFQAACMAYGAFLARKRPQAVMTHANVGAANALLGLIGASRMNIPVIFISGMTAQTERAVPGSRDKLIHWSQDTKDQGAMFREYVKWEAVISDESTVDDVLDRAFAIAMSPPYGPVAIKVSRDVLVRSYTAPIRYRMPAPSMEPSVPSANSFATIANWLSVAERPLFVTNRLGLDSDSVALLVNCSEKHQIGVLCPDDFYMSFPSSHSHHLGFRPNSALRECDLAIILDTDAPWFPIDSGPPDSAKILHLGPDPCFQLLPLRSHRGDLYVQCAPRDFLAKLLETETSNAQLVKRGSWIAEQRRSRPRPSPSEKLDAQTVSAVLSEFMGPDTVLINELGLNPEALCATNPGGYFRSGAASPLGWGVGCALGYSLGDRSKTVIAAIGDGVFFLSPIHGALLSSIQTDSPFVLVILNNGGMESIRKTVGDFYGVSDAPVPLTTLGARGICLEKSADLVSGLGQRAETSDELRRCLENAVEYARTQRRPAVINAICES